MEKIIEIPEGYEARIEGNKVVLEPKESEDERTRKSLLAYIKGESKRLDTKKWIAYLEKQKEQKPVKDDTRAKIISRATSEKQVVLLSESNGNAEIGWDTRSLEDAKKLLEYGITFINKQLGAKWQKEQKPNYKYGCGLTDEQLMVTDFWKEYLKESIISGNKPTKADIDFLLPIARKYFALAMKESCTICKDWSNGYQKGLEVAEQKPAEWSEEDENALKYLHELISFGFTEKFFDAQTAADMRAWLNDRLKSLRPQPKQEWSENDLERAIEDWLYDNDCRGWDKYGNIYVSLGDLVKLVNRFAAPPHWKPSEEQMEWLEQAVRLSANKLRTHDVILSLYNDLKKLM